VIWLPRKKIITSRHRQRGNIVVTVVPPPPDPLFGAVTFLMDCEETVFDSQVITPTVGPEMTALEASGGIAKISNAEAKFGTQSMLADDTAGLPKAEWHSAAHFAGAHFPGDFTVEFHYFPTEANATGRNTIGVYAFPQREWLVAINNNTPGDFRTTMLYSDDGTTQELGFQELWNAGNHPTGGALNTWAHIAMSRQGNNWFTHADGFQVGSTRVSSTPMFQGTSDFQIGGAGGSGPDSTIYIDNVRITKGVSRYSPGDFTPPDAPYSSFGP